ncbi:hypothetical protein Dimus_029590 [Dionaea muscipula]
MPGGPRSYPHSILLLSGSGPAAAAAAGSNSEEDDVLKKLQQQAFLIMRRSLRVAAARVAKAWMRKPAVPWGQPGDQRERMRLGVAQSNYPRDPGQDTRGGAVVSPVKWCTGD